VQQGVWRQWGATKKQSAFSIIQHLIRQLNQIQIKNRSSTIINIWALVQADINNFPTERQALNVARYLS
jgi:hypothetical protein